MLIALQFFVILLGPFYLVIKLMSVSGFALYVLFPVVCIVLARRDASKWAFVGNVTWQPNVVWRTAFASVVLLTAAIYGIYQIYAGILMGAWPDSYWIFNVDNSQRLIHAISIAGSSTYPPDIIAMTPSGAHDGHHYHFGSPGLGALIAEIIGEDPGSAYLRYTASVLLIPALIVPFFVIYDRTKSVFFASVPVALFLLPQMQNLTEFYKDAVDILREVGRYGVGTGSLSEVRALVADSMLNKEVLGNWVQNGTTVSILCTNALFMTAFVSFRWNSIGWIFLGILPALAMMNTRLLFIVSILILLIFVGGIGARQNRLSVVVLFGGAVFVGLLSGLFGGVELFQGKPYAIGIRELGEREIPRAAEMVAWIIPVLLVALNRLSPVSAWLKGDSEHHHVWVLLFGLWISLVGLAVLQPTIRGGWSMYQALQQWMNLSFLVWALFIFFFSTVRDPGRYETASEGVVRREPTNEPVNRLVHYMIIVGLLGVISAKGVHAGGQIVGLRVWPGVGHEAADLSGHYECLSNIENDGVIAATNEAYPAGNYRRERKYGTFIFLQGHRETTGFREGIEVLSDPDQEIGDIVEYSEENTATHVFIVKRFRYAKILRRFITFENETCAVVPFDAVQKAYKP